MTAVAIFTDASIYQGVGAWATVILREGHAMREHAGRLRGRFDSSTAVEACAVANALHRAAADRMVEPGDLVDLYCDNRHVVDRICAARGPQPWRDSGDQAIMRAVAYALEAERATGVRLRMRWIKGHQRLDSRDPNAIYNRRCDQLCGAARKGVPAPTWEALVAHVAEYQRRRDNREAKEAREAKACANG